MLLNPLWEPDLLTDRILLKGCRRQVFSSVQGGSELCSHDRGAGHAAGFTEVNAKPLSGCDTFLGHRCSGARFCVPSASLRGQTNTLRSHQLAVLESIYSPETASAVVAAGRPAGGRERRVGRWGLGWPGDRQPNPRLSTEISWDRLTTHRVSGRSGDARSQR